MLANPFGDSILFGSKPGDEAITYTWPVFGLRTTAAPHFPRSALSAIFCAFTRRLSTRLLPRIVAPFRLSVSFSMIVPTFAFPAVRYAFSCRSIPARERPCVE